MQSRLNRGALVAVTLLAAAFSTGCGTVVKHAYYELRGAQGKVLPNDEVGNTVLGPYQSVRFKPATTTLKGELCPPDVVRAYDGFADDEVADLAAVYAGGEPALVIDSEIQYFQKKGLLGSSQLLVRLTMRDGERVVVDALVNAESKSFRAGGGDDLAQAAIKAVGRFLVRYKTGEERASKDDDKKGKRKEKD